jgi:hypothetical protein
VKKTYAVQLFTEEGSIARDIETGNIVEALRAFIVLIGYRKGETISITEEVNACITSEPSKNGIDGRKESQERRSRTQTNGAHKTSTILHGLPEKTLKIRYDNREALSRLPERVNW